MTRINATETTPLIPEIPPEVSDVERNSPDEPKTYSHAFIARVVVALLIGESFRHCDSELTIQVSLLPMPMAHWYWRLIR